MSGKTKDFNLGEGRKILHLDELDAFALSGTVLKMLVLICKDGGANAVAIFKKKDLQNYSPVNKTSTCGKVLKKIINL